MAQNNQDNTKTNSFDGKLNQDVQNFQSKANAWSFARNATTFSATGDLYSIQNEPSNKLCIKTPYTIIGFIYLFSDTWAVFSTDDTNSEIGRFVESTCTYTKVVNDSCLNFNRANLIIGVSKENHDCSWHIYWADGNNPDRQMNFDKPAYIQLCTDSGGNTQLGTNPPSSPFYPQGCITCVDTVVLDCDALRMARLTKAPCMHLIKGAGGGNLLNGSYFVVGAYMVSGQQVTDFFTPSNVQALFEHSNVAGSIDVVIDSMDERYDEFMLVVVSIVNQQTTAKRFGVYSTRQKRITIDIIDSKLVDVPIAQIPLHNPIVDKSEAMYEVGNYLVRVSPTNKFDFNYQPLANQIRVKWQSVEYPADYYRKGGTNTSRLRDENYAEFIQWIYDDGDLSSAYHIPGRPPVVTSLTGTMEDAALGAAADSLDVTDRVFEVYNTATQTLVYPPNTLSPDGEGFLLAEGLMGYWESTEKYPDDKPTVYNASTFGTFVPPYPATGVADYDLCGKAIRHHKFPEQALRTQSSISTTQHYTASSPNFGGKPAIRILGTSYENIKQPLDNSGNPIPGIVGYRILRGSREGNKTIVAKGILNNMFAYNIEGGATNRQGLYPNYPYNDVTPADPYISTTDTTESAGIVSGTPNTAVTYDKFTFHSPDTQFRNPYLSMKEVKVYGELTGVALGSFVEPNKHPKHKFITDLAFISATIAGIGIAVIAGSGKRTTTKLYPRREGILSSGALPGVAGLVDLLNPTTPAMALTVDGLLATAQAAAAAASIANDAGAQAAAQAASGFAPNTPGVGIDDQIRLLYLAAAALPGTTGYSERVTDDGGDGVPTLLRAGANAFPAFVNYWSQGTDATLELINALLRWEQHALQYQSHCFYDGWNNSALGEIRRSIGDEIYLDNQLQDFGINYRINNLFRGKSIAVEITKPLAPLVGDNTKQTLRSIITTPPSGATSLPDHQSPFIPFRTESHCYYASLKNRIRNQYGQLGGVHLIPINSCTLDTTATTFPVKSPVLFGGDTYVSRYTEKNTMFFFYDWLYGQPDGYEFNYHLKKYIPHPMYWMDTQKWDVSDFINNISGAVLGGNLPSLFPSSLHAFDRNGLANGGFFGIHDAYVYLSNSGVRDFFVESDVNTDLRDWGDNTVQRYYDPYGYTDIQAMFDMNPDIIKAGNYFKYDYSLSITKSFTQLISWANIQPINYDPIIYETCYVHYKNRVIYSLPQQLELIKDYWLVYLANNYKDFLTPVTAIKPINKSGAVFFFETQSPQQMIGVDTIRLGSGADATVGTGALFSQPLQNLISADRSFETASCQSRLSVVNTPTGLYWISQTTGAIYQYQLGGGMSELSGVDLNWWLIQYLPCMLTQSFPTFELIDNPVIGVGCQTTYDQQNSRVYFMKKDYKLRVGFIPVTGTSTLANSVQYLGVDNFLVGGMLPIKLGDPVYFEDASFTVSYDPTTKAWISYHDWHPELTMAGKNTFLTTQTDALGQGGLWVHNAVCNSYCNFYGVDYPFEVEYRSVTGQQTEVVRSVEHQVEVYIYDPNNCHDRFMQLSTYFDRAVIFNQEQVSGYLNLILAPSNDPWLELTYPKINPNSIDILYSKVEGKYRFNAFFDVTDDRGQSTNAKRMIFNTAANGYVKTLNPLNVNYNKDVTQLKRIREYNNSVWLQKKISGSNKIILLIVNNKLQQSPR